MVCSRLEARASQPLSERRKSTCVQRYRFYLKIHLNLRTKLIADVGCQVQNWARAQAADVLKGWVRVALERSWAVKAKMLMQQ